MNDLPFDLVPFDRDDDSQRAFIYDTFRRSMGCQFPWGDLSPAVLMARFKRELARPGTTVALIAPKGMADDWLGWVAVRPRENTVVFAFTKYSARRMGVATSALLALGLCLVDDEGTPVNTPVVFWTVATSRIRAKGGYAGLYPTMEYES